jgi:hypothetical protein
MATRNPWMSITRTSAWPSRSQMSLRIKITVGEIFNYGFPVVKLPIKFLFFVELNFIAPNSIFFIGNDYYFCISRWSIWRAG